MATRATRQERWRSPLTRQLEERWRSPLTRQLEELNSPAETLRCASQHGDHCKARDEWACATILDRFVSDLSMANTTSSPSTPVAALQTRPGPSPRSSFAAETAGDGKSARVPTVRGVVAVQSPSLSAAEDFLMIISHGTVALQTLQKPYQKLLEMPLDEVAAKVVPGRQDTFWGQDTFWVTNVGFEDRDSDPDTNGILVVLRDRSLRDQWLEALATAGAHVDVAGACLAASTGAASYPDAPVRWLR